MPFLGMAWKSPNDMPSHREYHRWGYYFTVFWSNQAWSSSSKSSFALRWRLRNSWCFFSRKGSLQEETWPWMRLGKGIPIVEMDISISLHRHVNHPKWSNRIQAFLCHKFHKQSHSEHVTVPKLSWLQQSNNSLRAAPWRSACCASKDQASGWSWLTPNCWPPNFQQKSLALEVRL